mmetsp:Transcript_145297/g.464232  ORF Transcript_145297/g.464232 Transcript_145297/m.464232 type:complete len:277 (-) Transcript_145297:655-1485(-)
MICLVALFRISFGVPARSEQNKWPSNKPFCGNNFAKGRKSASTTLTLICVATAPASQVFALHRRLESEPRILCNRPDEEDDASNIPAEAARAGSLSASRGASARASRNLALSSSSSATSGLASSCKGPALAVAVPAAAAAEAGATTGGVPTKFAAHEEPSAGCNCPGISWIHSPGLPGRCKKATGNKPLAAAVASAGRAPRTRGLGKGACNGVICIGNAATRAADEPSANQRALAPSALGVPRDTPPAAEAIVLAETVTPKEATPVAASAPAPVFA